MGIEKKEIIKRALGIGFGIIAIAIVGLIILKYQVKGETNMPFNLSKITVISTAEGVRNEVDNQDFKWNINVNQSNDIYFFVDKNENHKKQAVIDFISIENIKILQAPSKGEVKIFMPNSGEGRRFLYDEMFLVKEKLTYQGAKESNEKALQIGNQGGKALIRFANINIATYKSNDDTEIKHDGTLLTKTGVKNEEIQFKANFDLVIKIDDIKYKANITLDFPCGNILDNGMSETEKTDMSDIVFKRI